MANIQKLVDGMIPAYSQCPFASACELKKVDNCGHQGERHSVPYSCGLARLFEIFGTGES